MVDGVTSSLVTPLCFSSSSDPLRSNPPRESISLFEEPGNPGTSLILVPAHCSMLSNLNSSSP